MNIPLLGQNGNHPPGEMYIPGRRYEIAAKLADGNELTAHVGLNIPPEAVPNPFIPENVLIQWAAQQIAGRTVTKSVEGPWIVWANVAAIMFVGPVPT